MSAYTCSLCPRSFSTDTARYLHTMNDHTAQERGETGPTGPTSLIRSGSVPEEYAGARAKRAAARRARIRLFFGARFSDVASDGACPRCGGRSFKAKRSALGKSVGALFGGIGILLAPKSEVRCESCGQTFKRG